MSTNPSKCSRCGRWQSPNIPCFIGDRQCPVSWRSASHAAMNGHFGNWTQEQRDELVSTLREETQKQIEGDPELRAMVDWAIHACDLKPSLELYRLIFLVSVIMATAGGD